MGNTYEFESLETLKNFFQKNNILYYREENDSKRSETIGLTNEDFFDFFFKKVESPIIFSPRIDAIERYLIDRKIYNYYKDDLIEEYPQYKEMIQSENFYSFFSEFIEKYNNEQNEKKMNKKNIEKFFIEPIASFLYFLYQGIWFETKILFENYEEADFLADISELIVNNIYKYSDYDENIKKEKEKRKEKEEKLRYLLENDSKFRSSTNDSMRREYYRQQKEKETEIFELLDSLYGHKVPRKIHDFYQQIFRNK